MQMKLLKNFKKADLPVFKKSLFFEGLRQLRAPGIAYSVIAAILTLQFLLSGLRNDEYAHTYTLADTLEFQTGEAPIFIFLLASFFAVLAVFYITNFMRSAKARDFYCAAPHSHGTLWLNFVGSALAWTAAGVLAFFLMCCAILMPFDPKVIGALFFVACNVFASVLMVFGMAVLAVTLTGRLVPALATLAGFSALSMSLKIAFNGGWSSVFAKFNLVTKASDLEMYDPIYFILRRMFLSYSYNNLYSLTVYRIFSSWQTIGYGLLMGAVMLAIASVFATIRTGDTAGKAFVNELAHVISLTAVTLPIGTGISYFFFKVCENVVYRNRYATFVIDGSGIFPFILSVLFVAGGFWALELLLTFDVKNAHRAVKYLPIPVAVTMAALLLGFFGMRAEFNTVPAADEVESFTLVRNDILPDELAFLRMKETFGRTVTDEAAFNDAETIRYVTGIMKELSDKNGHDLQKAYNEPSVWESENSSYYKYDKYSDGNGNSFITLRLNLKNGKQLYRTVAFDQKHIKCLASAILSDSDFMKKFLTMPAADKINVGFDGIEGMTGDEAVAVYKSFTEEYNSLSDAEKLDFIKSCVMRDSFSYNAEEETTDEDEIPAPETVSPTELNLISKSKKPGDYAILESYFNEKSTEDGVDLRIAGYPEGELYNVEHYFNQSLLIDSKRFPKTIALIVRTCNAKFKNIPDRVKASVMDEVYRFCDFDASYYSNGNSLTVLYVYLNGNGETNADLNVPGRRTGSYDEDEKVLYKDIEVDSNEMIERLFKDTAATETIDFTKPYCKFTWNNSESRRSDLPRHLTFYAQTDFPSIGEE